MGFEDKIYNEPIKITRHTFRIASCMCKYNFFNLKLNLTIGTYLTGLCQKSDIVTNKQLQEQNKF